MTNADIFTGDDLVDILSEIPRTVSLYSGKGYIQLVDCCPRLVPKGRDASFAAARSARQSYQSGLKSINADRSLIKFLIRNRHTSPLEFANITFHIKAPIFVVRQFQRHRVWKFSELSRRYTESSEEDFWHPMEWREQSSTNKQCSEGEITDREELDLIFNRSTENSFRSYKQLLEKGASKEQARAILPVSNMTELYASIDLHNLFKFLDLRLAWDAQKEIAELAEGMRQLAYPVFKDAFDAWAESSSVNTLSFSEKEVKAMVLGHGLETSSVSERAEFKRKVEKWKVWADQGSN